MKNKGIAVNVVAPLDRLIALTHGRALMGGSGDLYRQALAVRHTLVAQEDALALTMLAAMSGEGTDTLFAEALERKVSDVRAAIEWKPSWRKG